MVPLNELRGYMTKEKESDPRDRYFSRAVSNALQILDLLSGSISPLTMSEIARKTGINKTSVFRFLYTMEETGHVSKDEAGRYSTSYSGNEQSSFISPGELRSAALSHMKTLRSRYSETVSLGILMKNHIEVIEVLDSPHLIRMGNRLGAILPPHASSMGKAITAFQEEELQDRLINGYGMIRLTGETIIDDIRLKEEYSRIREKGWSHDDRESAAEGQCFGAPIRLRGRTIAALSISFPSFRVLEGKNRQVMLRDLQKAGRKISEDLDFASH